MSILVRITSITDLQGILIKIGEIKHTVDAVAVSSYFSPLNPEHEIRTHKAISQICDLPLVLGHQLSTKLGSVERATTAALNLRQARQSLSLGVYIAKTMQKYMII